MTQDVLNNDISADQACTIAGINDFILGYLGYDLRLVKILEVADQSEDCLANTYAGLLWMLSETGDVRQKRADIMNAQLHPLPVPFHVKSCWYQFWRPLLRMIQELLFAWQIVYLPGGRVIW